MLEYENIAEFRDQSANSSYPFVDGVDLPAAVLGLVLDAHVFAEPGQTVALVSIVASGSSLVFSLSSTPIASRTIAGTWSDPNNDVVRLVDNTGMPSGKLVVDVATATLMRSTGASYEVEPAGFLASNTLQLPAAALRGIKVGNTILRGNVVLLGSRGVTLTSPTGIAARIDITGDPFAAVTACQLLGETPQTKPTVKTINLVRPSPLTREIGLKTGAIETNTALRINNLDGEIEIRYAGL